MPIECEIALGGVSDSDFECVDAAVMSCAYATHNKLGRLCDEHVYECDLAARLQASGIGQVDTQVAVTTSFRSFEKIHRLDLVVNGVVYELKAVDALTSIHDAQVYHYAALLNLDRIKILNFGANRVGGRLHRCPFGTMDRRQVVIDRSRWGPCSVRCIKLAEEIEACFRDWGGFLEARLFEDAMIFFNGGDSGCRRKLPVIRDNLLLGHHKAILHAEDVAFVVTSLSETNAHERHLRSLLSAIPIRGWQWINIYHRTLRMITIQKP